MQCDFGRCYVNSSRKKLQVWCSSKVLHFISELKDGYFVRVAWKIESWWLFSIVLSLDFNASIISTRDQQTLTYYTFPTSSWLYIYIFQSAIICGAFIIKTFLYPHYLVKSSEDSISLEPHHDNLSFSVDRHLSVKWWRVNLFTWIKNSY